MQTQTEQATKYTYNPFDQEWHGYPCRVVVEKRPFAEGGMRCCLRMFELEETGGLMPCVAKVFKKQSIDKSKAAYFDEAFTQMAAECFAQDFNRRQQKFRVSFLPVSVMLLEERQMQLCCVEPLMTGAYVKHNDNDGHVETHEQLPQTFSHFTWEASKHRLVVVDIQGVGDCYTDPQIHSIEGTGFGAGNTGPEGILKFLKSHTCNRACEHLQLPTMSRSLALSQVEKALERVKGLKSRLHREAEATSPGENFRHSPLKELGRRGTPGTPTSGDPNARLGGNWTRTPTTTTLNRAGSSERARSPARRSPSQGMSPVHSMQDMHLKDLQSAIEASEAMLSNMDPSKLTGEQLDQVAHLQKNLASLQMMRDSSRPSP